MCVTLSPGSLSGTLLLAHALPDGRRVLAYQNRATTELGPNAMLLPFPSAGPMSSRNCVDLSGFPDLLRRYADLTAERARGVSLSACAAELEVFDSGNYTVVLSSVSAIPGALERVREERRPAPNFPLFRAYARWYPRCSFALCCWDGAMEAEPMLWVYEPSKAYRDVHFIPGLEWHEGGVPDLDVRVNVSSTVIVGTEPSEGREPNASRFLDAMGVPPEIRRLLPEHVCGQELGEEMVNGDWVLPLASSARELQAALHGRHRPPGASLETC